MELRKEIRQGWDDFAPRYGSRFGERMEERLHVAEWRRQLPARASGRVLEIATGTGPNLPRYPEFCEITATDLSPGMLDMARKRASSLELNVDFRTMDAEALDFPGFSFDTVVECNSLCVFPNPITALREMGRVCRSDGRILLLEHGRSHHRWVGRLQEWDVKAKMTYDCERNRAYDDLIRQAGLTTVFHQRQILGMYYVMEARPSRKDA